MSEQRVTVEVFDQDDCDKTLTITMSVGHSANVERFIGHLKDELQTLSHDTFKGHWDWRPSEPAVCDYCPHPPHNGLCFVLVDPPGIGQARCACNAGYRPNKATP